METTYYWNEWYNAWGWFLWFAVIMLFFGSVGNWGYTYRTHRRYRDLNPNKDAFDQLAQRYASGEISREEFHRIKDELMDVRLQANKIIPQLHKSF